MSADFDSRQYMYLFNMNIYIKDLWVDITRGYSEFSTCLAITRNSFYENRLKCIGTLTVQSHNIEDVAPLET